ncbi:hypothetical protein IV49_GL000714 [Kandleria vitulina DSM 20405]|uniref:Uncharacterized protein n=1 Tax=Kandleria vitulina DSM 20405 TaxID=1410657 RepID=A0A0R2HE06_9FIRM|nr:hypothetical protein [Kandleria vitulina]KRN51250.1 hypothetical protein IV49_GL000714 [Kandleria vitulina DSM 20405]
MSVASGKLASAIETIKKKDIKGTIVLFCNFWDERREVEALLGDYEYITAFPTAGGHMESQILNCVLFDHIMLEGKEKAHISNYD